MAWTISYLSGVSSWVSYYEVEGPSNDIDVQSTSTRNVSMSYTGKKIRTIPTQKYVYEDIDFEWMFIKATSNLKTDGTGIKSLNTLKNGGYKIRIKDHNAKVYEGYISKYGENMLVSYYSTGTQYYVLSITMDVISIT